MALALAGFILTGLSAQAQTISDYKAAAQSMVDSFQVGVSKCSQSTIDAAAANLASIQSQVAIITAQIQGLNSSQQSFASQQMTQQAQYTSTEGVVTASNTASSADGTCAKTGEPVYLDYLSWNGTTATYCCDPNDGIKVESYPRTPDYPSSAGPNSLNKGRNVCLYPIDAAGAYCVAGWDQTCGNGACGTGEDRCNCPQDCMETSPKTCEEACKDIGWGTGYCDMYKNIFGVATVWVEGCIGTQKRYNFASDCKLTTGVTDEGRECCCVAKPARSCIAEGKAVKPFIENLNSQQTRIYWRTNGLQNEECCAGLSPLLVIAKSNSGRCVESGGKNLTPSSWRQDKYVCANCGNGTCGAGENSCNCPADCK